jgi:hypothetical protein
MSEERRKESGRFANVIDASEGENRGSPASRARNRTVLLPADAVGQVRASVTDASSGDPINDLLPPMGGWDDSRRPSRGGDDDADTHYGDRLEEERPFEASRREAANVPSGNFRRPQPASGFSAPQLGGRGSKSPTSSHNRAPAPSSFEEERYVAAPRPKPTSKVIGFLISYDAEPHGEVYDIRAGRWLVTSRPTDHGEYILIDDPTISSLHAIIRATVDGKVQVLDQLSEHGTGVLRVGSTSEEEVAGAMTSVNHGDSVRFGKRHFVICLVPAAPSASKTEAE